jgi:hypothetical protein
LPFAVKRAPGPLKLLGLGDVALRSFAGTNPEAPMGEKLGETALNTAAFVGAPKVGEAVGTALGQRGVGALGRRLGSTAGTLGAFESVNAATAAMTGQEWNPLTPEHVAGTLASVLPFEAVGAGMDVMQKWNEYRAKEREVMKAKELTQAREVEPEVPEAVPQVSEMALTPTPKDLYRQTLEIKAKHKLYTPEEVERYTEMYPDFQNETPEQTDLEHTRTRAADLVSRSQEMSFADAYTGIREWEDKQGIKLKDWIKENEPLILEQESKAKPSVSPMLTSADSDHLRSLEADGASTTTLATAAQNLASAKTRSKIRDPYVRVLHEANIDPRLNQAGDPTTFISTASAAFSKISEQLGISEADRARLEPWFLRFAATISKDLGHTKVALFEPKEGDETGKRSLGYFTPSRGAEANAFIGLVSHEALEGFKGLYEAVATLAHEALHNHESQADRETFTPSQAVRDRKAEIFKNLRAQTDPMTTDEMQATMRALARLLSNKTPDELFERRMSAYTNDVVGHKEFRADMFKLTAMAAMSPRQSRTFKAIDDLLRFGQGDFGKVLRGIVEDLALLFHHLAGFSQPLFNFGDSTTAKVVEIHKQLQKLLASADEAERATQHFLSIMNAREARPWEPALRAPQHSDASAMLKAYFERSDPEVGKLIDEVSPMVVPQMQVDPLVEQKRFKLFNYFQAVSQMGHTNLEELADMRHLGRNYGSLSREFVSTYFSFFRDPHAPVVDLGFIKIRTKSDAADLYNLAKEGTPMNKAWSQMTLRQNEYEKANNGKALPTSEVEKLPAYSSLSPQDKQTFLRLKDGQSAANVWAANKAYDSFRNKVGIAIASGLQSHDPTIAWQDAQKVGNALASMNLDNDVYTFAPNLAAERWGSRERDHQPVLDEYAKRGPKQAAALEKMAEAFKVDENNQPEDPTKVTSFASKLIKYREQLSGAFRQDKDTKLFDFDGRPGWSPEVRLGRWILAYKLKGEEPVFTSFKHKAELDSKIANLNKLIEQGQVEYVKRADKTDLEDRYAGMDPDRFATLAEVVDALNKRVVAKMGNEHPELSSQLRAELLDELKPQRAMAAALESPHMKERRLVRGREDLNMAEGMLHYANNTAYTIAKRYEVGQQNLYLRDPKMVANPQLQKLARAYFSEITDPTEKGSGFIKKLLAFNYIFFSPSLAFVELTQQGTNHIPAMLMQGMGMGEALNAVREANVDAVAAFLKGKKLGLTDNVYDDVFKDGTTLTDVVRRARKDNIVGAGVGWQQEAWELAHDVEFINKQNVFNGNGTLLDRTGLIGKPLYQMYKVGANMHGIAIALNTEVAFVSAFRHFAKTMSTEEAYRKAADVTQESMHGGGRAARPLWFLGVGDKTPGATVGGIMYSLQSYVYNSVSQMARYLSLAIKNTVKNPTELSAAHKAAATMLGAQLVLAGVAGIPITGQMLALVEQAFPNTEPRRRMREAFFGLGRWLNDKTHLVGQDEDMGHFLETAAMDGLMTTMAPWNLGNRFELGVLMGVDPYKGFDWKNVVGPGGPLLEQILLKPLQAASEGKYSEMATAWIPNSNTRRLVEEATHGWELRNQDQRLNLTLDQNEKVLLALGFTPKRVAEFRELDKMKKRAEAVNSLDQKKFNSRMADRLLAGDQETVTQGLLQRAGEVPNYDPREGARQIAELVQQRTIPYDPMRTGSRTSRSYTVGQLFDLQRSADQPTQQPLEVERYFQRLGLQQTLGFPEPPSPGALREAQLVDMLQRQNPAMSRQEALELVARQLRPRTASRIAGYAGQSF